MIFIGPLPPPVHGQAISTRELLDRLRQCEHKLNEPLVVYDTGERGRRGLTGHGTRVWQHCRALFSILMTARRSPRQLLYVSLNAGSGMILTLAIMLAARLRRFAVLVHHHTYGHLNETSLTASWLFRWAGPDCRHIMICKTMGADASRAYAVPPSRLLTLSNAFMLPRDRAGPDPVEDQSREEQERPLILGHLSNLSMNKGFAECVDTLRALHERGVPAKLVMAGPADAPDVVDYRRRLDEPTLAHMTFLGPVGEPEKTAFFTSLDFFLFPTRYHNETQGIVNLEALSFGVPIVAIARCCMVEDLAGEGAILVRPEEDFGQLAATRIQALMAQPEAYRAARRAAKVMCDRTVERADAELEALLVEMTGAAAT